ncbi:MAG: hypothetical protein KatS3mg077_1996 [Candidatus Binatia bacterium]|nr:MAG: hypothetical protein KatS3mg077_1996 [Candidatus Binatia bacterium]
MSTLQRLARVAYAPQNCNAVAPLGSAPASCNREADSVHGASRSLGIPHGNPRNRGGRPSRPESGPAGTRDEWPFGYWAIWPHGPFGRGTAPSTIGVGSSSCLGRTACNALERVRCTALDKRGQPAYVVAHAGILWAARRGAVAGPRHEGPHARKEEIQNECKASASIKVRKACVQNPIRCSRPTDPSEPETRRTRMGDARTRHRTEGT